MADNNRNRLMDDITNFSHLMGNMIAVTYFLSAMRGKDVPENAPEEVKVAAKALKAGLRGVGDEVAYIRAIYSLSPTDRKILEDFVRWHYKTARRNSRVSNMFSLLYANRWRVALMNLNIDPEETGEQTKEETTVINVPGLNAQAQTDSDQQQKNTRGGNQANAKNDKKEAKPLFSQTVKTTTKGKTYSQGSAGAVEFLEELVAIIKRRSKRMDGYRDAERHLRSIGFPTMPSDKVIEGFEEFFSIPGSIYRGAVDLILKSDYEGIEKYIKVMLIKRPFHIVRKDTRRQERKRRNRKGVDRLQFLFLGN